eukprot:CAMPEP_0204322068 /NCGR_PEP_ID=MMETSP0469-20131031/8491_1 /ASSEMBLY_ACC=CAM_ASM_000384 /TAXON_ID=2969 /ORGANISM="Oxyrrhis marina" /LENGTH=183 /DNA_ID=CAMNT_0051303393 /DNA_START=49 /DNA_END=600 /DNA_ORIENTATION=-
MSRSRSRSRNAEDKEAQPEAPVVENTADKEEKQDTPMPESKEEKQDTPMPESKEEKQDTPMPESKEEKTDAPIAESKEEKKETPSFEISTEKAEAKNGDKDDRPDTLATHLTEETRAARIRLDKSDEDSSGRRRSTKPAWMTNPDYCSKVGNTEFMAGKPGFETGEVKKVDPGDPLGDFFNNR